MGVNMDFLVGVLRNLRVHMVMEEFMIHDQIKDLLDREGFDYSHEYKLGKGNRIDFLVGGIGVEVKKGKPNRSSVLKQLERYSESDEVKGLVLVIERSMDIPDFLNGKPCEVVALNKLWF